MKCGTLVRGCVALSWSLLSLASVQPFIQLLQLTFSSYFSGKLTYLPPIKSHFYYDFVIHAVIVVLTHFKLLHLFENLYLVSICLTCLTEKLNHI